jgi:hypothetical protein
VNQTFCDAVSQTYAQLTKCPYSHQLGSHQASKALYLSEKEKVLSQRLYITTRMLDAYITSSLGLPRNFRAVEAPAKFTAAPYINGNIMLAVSSANIELLEIMSDAREKMYFTGALSRMEGLSVVALDQLDELSKTLDQWASRYNVSGQTSHSSLSNCTKLVQFQQGTNSLDRVRLHHETEHPYS